MSSRSDYQNSLSYVIQRAYVLHIYIYIYTRIAYICTHIVYMRSCLFIVHYLIQPGFDRSMKTDFLKKNDLFI